MLKLQEILDNYSDVPFILIDGFDEAVVGMTTDFRLVYCVGDMIDILVKEGDELDDAIEHFEYNISSGLPIGDHAPILFYTDFF